MSTSQAEIGQKLDLVGDTGSDGLVNGTYNPGATFFADAVQDLAAMLALAVDVATNLTSMTVKLQGRHREWPADSWVDLQTTLSSSGETAAEHALLAADVDANGIVPDALLTNAHRFFTGGLRLVAKATGGATKSGDVAEAWMVGW